MIHRMRAVSISIYLYNIKNALRTRDSSARCITNMHINIPWSYQLSDAGMPDIVASSVLLSRLRKTEQARDTLSEQNIGRRVRM